MSAAHHQAPHELCITGDHDAGHLLTTSGNALLLGMVLDQRLRSPLRSSAHGLGLIEPPA